MSGPQIARDEDLDQLVELLGLLFSQEAEFAPDARKQRLALSRILDDSSIGRIYVVREGERVLGMCSLLYTVSTAEGGRAAWLEDFVVRPERRGRGIGRMLLAHVIAQARGDGVLRISLLTDAGNERAQDLYRSVGFAASAMRPMRLRRPGAA
ncbi:MAG TPA: GNAT family N-acetyltransferase [Burkholderiales bacterium]|nr:GNAT family N-acetyltransferase [Burkholderiales bacterium]